VSAPRRVALVTGAARRVGRSIALELAGRGYDVVVHYHTSERDAGATVVACRERGAHAIAVQADLADSGTAAPLVARAEAEFGRLDALVNSAAVFPVTPLRSVTVEDWDSVMNVNLRAPFFLSLAARAVMHGGGSIVNVSDHLAERASSGLIPHAVSKAGLTAMTRHLARHFAPTVRVNAVVPGAVLPPDDWAQPSRDAAASAAPLKRLGSPADVAQAIAYLLEAEYVTGHTLVVDGGLHLG
jgi:pteridine reductase